MCDLKKHLDSTRGLLDHMLVKVYICSLYYIIIRNYEGVYKLFLKVILILKWSFHRD